MFSFWAGVLRHVILVFPVALRDVIARSEFLHFVVRHRWSVAENVPFSLRQLALIDILSVAPVLEAGRCVPASAEPIPSGVVAETSLIVHRPRPFGVTRHLALTSPRDESSISW